MKLHDWDIPYGSEPGDIQLPTIAVNFAIFLFTELNFVCGNPDS